MSTNHSSEERLGASIADQAALKTLQTTRPLSNKERKRRESAERAANSTQTPASVTTVASKSEAGTRLPKLTLPTLDSFRARREAAATKEQLAAEEAAWEKAVETNINEGSKEVWVQRVSINQLSGLQLELREEDIKSLQTDFLNRKDGLMVEHDVMRRYLVRTFARRLMFTCPLEEDEVKFMVRFLEPFGFFQIFEKEVPKSNFLFGRYIKLGDEYQDEQSKTTLAGVLKIQEDIKAQRQANWIKSQRAIRVAAGSKESQLPIDQVGYQKGLKLLFAPDWIDNHGNDRRGGDLLIQSHEDGFVEILMGTSGCQRIADQAVEFAISVHIDEINNGRLNRIASSDEDVKRATFAIFKTLQRAINFAFDEAEEAAGRVAEREHFKSLETLTAEQFHATPRPAGAYFVDPLPVGASYLVPKFFNRKPVYKDGRPVLVQAGLDATDVFYLFVSGDDGKLTESPFPKRLNGFFGRNPHAFGRLVQMDREKFERSQSKSVSKVPESLEDFERQMEAADASGVVEEATPAVEAVAATAATTKPETTPRKKRAAPKAKAKAKSGTKTSAATAKN